MAKSTLNRTAHRIRWYAESSAGRTGHRIGENQYTAGRPPDRIALDTDFGKWHPAGPDTASAFGESAPDRTHRIRWHPETGPDTVPDRIAHFGPGRKSTPDRTGRTGYDTRAEFGVRSPYLEIILTLFPY